MNYKRYTPEEIVSDEMKFSIPLYQRLFVWDETQVSKLLTDLYKHFLKPKVQDKPYYLGQMTIVKESGQCILIDGQQRFTVMILLALVLRKYDADWDKFLMQNDDLRLSFTGRSECRQYILDRYRNGTKAHYAPMEKVMNCIESFIQEKESKGFSVADFSKRIFKQMSFFLTELPYTYMQHPVLLNRHFEAMNSTGKMLESHEILKVELMRGCDEQVYLTRIWNLVSRMEQPLISPKAENGGVEKCRERYTAAIQECIQDRFSCALELCVADEQNQLNTCPDIADIKANPLPSSTFHSQPERSVLSFPDFLLLVLDLTNGAAREISDSDFYQSDKLLSRFQEYKPSNIKSFYNNLLMYRLLLDFYVDRVRYDVQGAGHHYLLFNEGNEENHHHRLRQYEAMLHVSTHNSYKWLKPFLTYIIKGRAQVTSAGLLQALKEIDNKNHPFVNSIEDLSYGKVDRYWFWRLDYYLWENRSAVFKENVNEKAVSDYEFRANRSIEHLHPQNESQNKAWDESKYDLNGFGNLAMISQSFNSAQSNDPVEVKFARIKDQAATSDLQSLKLYHMYLFAGQTENGWTEEKAKESGEYMFGILADSYKSSNSEVK
mgnify:FL=1